MVDIRVVIPEDIGETIQMNAIVPNKYDVVFPEPIQSVNLVENNIVITSHKGAEHRVDLTNILPVIAKDVFLKNVEYTGDKKLRFTVGHRDDNVADQVFEVNISDLLPVVADELTITGNGTNESPLQTRVPLTHPTDQSHDISGEGDRIPRPSSNLIEKTPDGLVVSEKRINDMAYATALDAAFHVLTTRHRASIRLTNATGARAIGYIHETENM